MAKRKKMKCIEIAMKLPPNIAISNAGNHLYMYGISQYSLNNTSRLWIYEPKLVASIILLFIFRSLICLYIDNVNTLIKLGDWSHIFGIKLHLNIIIIN